MPEQQRLVLKYGGNAMRSDELQEAILDQVARTVRRGTEVILVHGGGPFIQQLLDTVRIPSEFIGGHRKTSPEALRYIEMALKGEVNGRLVNILNRKGVKAVGLSGKDGGMVTASRRFHRERTNGEEKELDIGLVGDVARIDPKLPELLLSEGYLPVVTCIASDEKGTDYNINADLFAGYLAGALQADRYLVLTDVDGLFRDLNDPASLIPSLPVAELPSLLGHTIKGGMIPKLESCRIALEQGARSAAIINGTRPEVLTEALAPSSSSSFPGTKIQPE